MCSGSPGGKIGHEAGHDIFAVVTFTGFERRQTLGDGGAELRELGSAKGGLGNDALNVLANREALGARGFFETGFGFRGNVYDHGRPFEFSLARCAKLRRMKIDVYTKAVLTVLAILLGVIALRPLVSPEVTANAQGGFAGVQYANMEFFDARSGQVYSYNPNGTLLRQYKVARLGDPLVVEKR